MNRAIYPGRVNAHRIFMRLGGRLGHGFGRDVVELLLAHSEKSATVAAYSHMELAADRKRALQFLADRVDALAAGRTVVPLRAA